MTSVRRPAPPPRSTSLPSKARPSIVVDEMRDRLRSIVAEHGGHDPMIFGSVARGDDTEDSDVDLIVTLPVDADLIDVLHLADDLEALTGVRFDIASGRSAGPVMQRARHEAVPL
jgi:predicted nucleotidyltransferase